MKWFPLLLICIQAHVSMAQVPASGSIIGRYAAYNTWANRQLADWLREAGEEGMNTELESSFPTLRETVMHLWGAETGWLATVQGREWEKPAEITDPDALLDAFLGTSKLFEAHVIALSAEEMTGIRSVGKWDRTVEDIVHHVFNHATYHRGQLITMGRQVGLSDPPRTDYIYFLSLVDR